MTRHPAVAFTEALCRKASEDGWKLAMDASHFMWAKGNDKLGAQSVSLDARHQLFTACVELDKAHYNLRVEL
jgi:hypothetical protein